MEIKMDETAIKAEISTQSKLMDSLPIDKALVSEIDRHIKTVEEQLNERLVHIPTKIIIQNYIPIVDNGRSLAHKVDDEVWENFFFGNIWYSQSSTHEEISFEKHNKGYSLFYTSGEVTFDLGVVESEGVDWYIRILKDQRQTHKLTGASVEIKLKAFQHLRSLIMEINKKANNIVSKFEKEYSTRNGLENLYRQPDFLPNDKYDSIANDFARMGQADAVRLLDEDFEKRFNS
jgi:hypothetical protein